MAGPGAAKRKRPAVGKDKSAPRRFAGDDEELASEEDDEEEMRFEGSSEEEEEDSEDEETAEEKRLRLAKAYLEHVRGDVEEGDNRDRDVREDGEDDSDGEEYSDKVHRDSLGLRLHQEARESAGNLQRDIASRVVIPDEGEEVAVSLWRGHKTPVTAVCLTEDGASAYSASKDGVINAWDVETGARDKFPVPPEAGGGKGKGGGGGGKGGGGGRGGPVLAMALSSDGRYLASSGGSDHRVHVWDARNRQHLQSFPGHKDLVPTLCFRQRTHQLFSGSYDRTIKIWSLDDMAYVDTLFGHSSEVLGVDCGVRERLVSSGRDHTCRVWKIPDETQLIFRGGGVSLDCCSLISPTEWVTGADDGSVSVWSQMRKKPQSTVRSAHGDGAELGSGATAGSVGGHVAGWVGAVASARGTDVVASGAGDGCVRLWAVDENSKGLKVLEPLYSVPARGFVNSLAMSSDGRVLLAGMGQEPRLGRWGRDKPARNGIIVHRVEYDDE